MKRHRALAIAAGFFTAFSTSIAAGAEEPPPLHAPGSLLGIGKTDAQTCDDGSRLTIGTSEICGVRDLVAPDIFVYRGIRYGSAKRWQTADPVDLPPSLDAIGYGNSCPQQSDTAALLGQAQSEDCLFLNVWRPAKGGSGRPVMVFIHGGAFLTGSGSDIIYDGGTLARRGAIVVTLNYRLGALGFLVGDKYGVASGGNLGMRDQQLALRWVQDHIAGFGGDPGRVTIFGESAGAMSVALHLFAMPDSAPLFQSALMESNVGATVYQDKSVLLKQGNVFLDYLCDHYGPHHGLFPRQACSKDTQWLANLPMDSIVKAQSAFLASIKDGDLAAVLRLVFGQSLPWQPALSLDDKFLVGQPFDGFAAGIKPKPFAFGVNRDEGAMFVGMGVTMLSPQWRNPAVAPLNLTYEGLLNVKFKKLASGDQPAATVIKTLDARYDPDKTKPTSGYSAAGTALANVLTDYVFTCGNVSMADNAVKQGAAAYAYYFSQPVFFSLDRLMVGDSGKPPVEHGACDPVYQVSCHAAELPYVFNMVSAVPLIYPHFWIGPDDAGLAERMNAAWFAFASNPLQPGPAWKPYTAGGNAYTWQSWQEGKPAALAAQAHCEVWKKQPY